MVNSKLILFDGIPGTGKSSTAQLVHLNLGRRGIANKWFHEEEAGHPLFYPDVNIQLIDWDEGLCRFMQKWPQSWDRLGKQITSQKEVVIITSYFLQDGARVLFNNDVPEETIGKFCADLERRIEEADPVFILFYVKDVKTLMKRIWKNRGDEWIRYFTSVDQNTRFARNRALQGEAASLALWEQFQALSFRIFENLSMRKLKVDVSDGNWSEIQIRVEDYLSVDRMPLSSTQISKESFIGHYRERGEGLDCRVREESGELICDFLWPGLKLIPLESSLFAVRSLPILFRFISEEQCTRIVVEGPGFYDITGKVFYKVE